MPATLYIASLYEKRRDEFKLEELRAKWQVLRHLPRSDGQISDDAPEVIEARKAYEDAGEEALKDCYFSDAYDQRNLLWLVGMDYWTEAERGVAGIMPVSRLKVLRDKLTAAELMPLIQTAIENGQKNEALPPGSKDRRRPEIALGDASFPEILDYFRQKRIYMLEFLDRAIALDEGVYWCV